VSTDTATLVRRSARLQTDDIDFDAFRSTPLDASSLRCLRYMHDIEGHTMCYLRDVLVTSAHKDPEITSFLAAWCYEEHWHGEALAEVLNAHGEPSGHERLKALRARTRRRDAARPFLFNLSSALTPHLTAVTMAWGAVNEWTTQAGYGRLAERANHPILRELLRRIMRQEGRHIDFYMAQARARLVKSRAAQRLARFSLAHWWAPVGAGVMPGSEVRFLARHLFGDEKGSSQAERVDRQIDRLPGLDGLHLLSGAVRTAVEKGLPIDLGSAHQGLGALSTSSAA
jgi:hypothetical protein